MSEGINTFERTPGDRYIRTADRLLTKADLYEVLCEPATEEQRLIQDAMVAVFGAAVELGEATSDRQNAAAELCRTAWLLARDPADDAVRQRYDSAAERELDADRRAVEASFTAFRTKEHLSHIVRRLMGRPESRWQCRQCAGE